MDSLEVRRQVASYLAGETSLRDLHSWLASPIWSDDVSKEVRSFANQIALRIDEFSSGVCNEEQLKGILLPLIAYYTAVMEIGSPMTCAATAQFSTAGSSMPDTPIAPVVMTPLFADR